LTEISLTWNLITIHALPKIPLILIGKEWQKVMKEMFSTLDQYFPPSQQNLLLFADNIVEGCSKLIS
jgi:predicted Rossmann-fold nucleotide-binding protein